MKTSRTYERVADGIYRDPRTGNFYERPKIHGRRTWRVLEGRTLKLARECFTQRRAQEGRAKVGLASSPYFDAGTVGQLCAQYQSAGCPNAKNRPRTGQQLIKEQSRIAKLLAWWSDIPAQDVRPANCLNYFDFRRRAIRAGGHGGRAIDLELATLTAILSWAVRQGLLPSNPLGSGRPRFRQPTIRHSRECAPLNAAELHSHAEYLLESRRSEVLGWQLLFEALTGCRTNEIVQLRIDAKHRGQPGYVDGDWLWLKRSKHGVNPFAAIHPALRECMAAHRAWHAERYPDSPWYFPSFRRTGKHVDLSALVKALVGSAAQLETEKRTSHGLRAFYVTVRRSHGALDSVIAAEIGDKTGASIIASTYGDIPPNWQGGEGLDWIPTDGEPAWRLWLPKNVVELPAVALEKAG